MSLNSILKASATSLLFVAFISIAAPHAHADLPANGATQTKETVTASPAKETVTGSPNPVTSSGDNSGTLLVNPLKNIDSLPDFLKSILAALIQLGTVVLILAFVWIGFSFVRAQGNPEALKKARAAFIWTIIGGAILLGAQAIADVIQSTAQSL